MDYASTFCICFSGITLRFVFPSPVALPDEFAGLLCADTGSPDAEYTVKLLTTPLRPAEPPVSSECGIKIYQTHEGWLRIYSALSAADGCQVACFLCPNGKNTLFYPASKWEFFSSPLHCAHLLGGENLLLWHDAFLLHSSVVQINGKSVLFSGPSCAGKSTQAALWHRYLGAEILNGDRCVVMKKTDGFYGGGSLWCGTSGIYRREQSPIAGIFLVHKAPENRVVRLGFDAFAPLFSQTIVNSWDPDFMAKVSSLYAELLSQVPVYRLDCRPDKGAVQVAYDTLF